MVPRTMTGYRSAVAAVLLTSTSTASAAVARWSPRASCVAGTPLWGNRMPGLQPSPAVAASMLSQTAPSDASHRGALPLPTSMRLPQSWRPRLPAAVARHAACPVRPAVTRVPLTPSTGSVPTGPRATRIHAALASPVAPTRPARPSVTGATSTRSLSRAVLSKSRRPPCWTRPDRLSTWKP